MKNFKGKRQVKKKEREKRFRDFPGGASGKESTCQCRRHKRREFDPWVGKVPWRRTRPPLQNSSLENPKDRGSWRVAGSIGLHIVGHD